MVQNRYDRETQKRIENRIAERSSQRSGTSYRQIARVNKNVNRKNTNHKTRRLRPLPVIILLAIVVVVVCLLVNSFLNKPEPVAELDVPKIAMQDYYEQIIGKECAVTLKSPTLPLVYVNSDVMLEAETAAALTLMMQDMEAEGLVINIESGYRSYEKQQELYDREMTRLRAEKPDLAEVDLEALASTKVAVPGTSEHQLGLAVDISVEGVKSASLHETKAGQWIDEHGADYGFILRYPEGKEDFTGVIFEPWHIRYVRSNLAHKLNESGLCMEEYQDVQAQQTTDDSSVSEADSV